MLDFFNCDPNLINDVTFMMNLTKKAGEASGARILESIFHAYSPYGLSIALFLAESHIFVHSWPEYGFVAADIFTCGQNSKPILGAHYLIGTLKHGRVKITRHYRGCSKRSLPLLPVTNIREERSQSISVLPKLRKHGRKA